MNKEDLKKYVNSISERQKFATLVLGYAILPGQKQWFEDGFDEENEKKFLQWKRQQP